MTHKIGFWSVFAIVTGSQIGSGVFMLPAVLAPYGHYGLLGWLLSGGGALMLALVFAKLCALFPRTGGPHVYVNQAFGPAAAFFTGWTYWVISWVSTTAVVVASIGYLSPLLGELGVKCHLYLEIGLLLIITWLNLKGVTVAGYAEFIFSVIKVVPLFLLPLVALFFFNMDHISVAPHVAQQPLSTLLNQVTLLTLWGFIGLESATTPAEAVENPEKTIPRAIIWGTICVILIYLLNSIGLMGVVPAADLSQAKAPYVLASQFLFKGDWHLLIAIIASIICIGTLNAWMLASGQIALGLAQDNLLSDRFKRKNKDDAPVWGIGMSCAGILSLLIFTSQDNMAHQVTAIIDFSVVAFLFVYAICCLAFLKTLIQQKGTWKAFLYGTLALSFCLWIFYETPLQTLLISFSFVLSGLPAYLYRRRTTQLTFSEPVRN